MAVEDWLDTVMSIEGVNFVAIDAMVAVQCLQLPGQFHVDPTDRMIVALARHFSVPLVTADTRIHAYRHVKDWEVIYVASVTRRRFVYFRDCPAQWLGS